MGIECVSVEAPLKATIAGEHAVVYGYPAVVMAIDKKIHIKICRRPVKILEVLSRGITITGDLMLRCIDNQCSGEIPGGSLEKIYSYLLRAIEISGRYFGDLGGLSIEISSEIPAGAGLGTSAAISAGIVAGYAYLSGRSLDPRSIASIAREVEIAVQGAASPMDTGAISLGGILLVSPREADPFKRISVSGDLEILVAVMPKKKSTRETVAMVREMLSRKRSIVENLLRVIGDISMEVSRAIEAGDLESLAELININHGILKALSIVDPDSERIVEILRISGVDGAKISGGGWGGAIIGIAKERSRLGHGIDILSRIGVKAFITGVSAEGLRIR